MDENDKELQIKISRYSVFFKPHDNPRPSPTV